MLIDKKYHNYKIINNLQIDKFRYATLLVIFILIILRQWDRIHYATLYAESSSIFFSNALTKNYSSILQPYAGYLQVAPELIAFFSYSISGIRYYPVLTLLISSFIYAYAITTITGKSYSWINISHIVRFFLALSLTILPGTPEILGNLANLHTVLFIYVTFRMLARFEEVYSPLDYVFFILTAFSAGEFFLILPILLYRIWVLYKSKSNLTQHLLILLIIIMSVVVTSHFVFESKVAVKHDLSDYIIFLKGYLPSFLLTVSNRFFYLPFLGNLTILLNIHVNFAIKTGLIMLFFIGFLSLSCKMYTDRYFILLFTVLISQMLEILLTVSVRDGIAGIIGQIHELKELWVRYSIYMMPFIIIFWQVFINRLLANFKCNYKSINILLVFISLYIIVINKDRILFENFYQVPGNQLAEKYLWNYNSNLISNVIENGNPDHATIFTAPFDWYFIVNYAKK